MEILFEIIGEFVIELFFETSKNKRIPLWIRIPLASILVLFYLFFTVILFIIGVRQLSNNLILGFLFIIIFVIILISFLYVFFKKK